MLEPNVDPGPGGDLDTDPDQKHWFIDMDDLKNWYKYLLIVCLFSQGKDLAKRGDGNLPTPGKNKLRIPIIFSCSCGLRAHLYTTH